MPLWILLGAIFVCFLGIGFINKRRQRAVAVSKKGSQSLKEVPWVSGCLPLLGHSIALKDMSGFLQQCYEKYGKIFKIKMFRVTLVVVADRSYAMEFFKAKEDQLSFYGMLNRIYLGRAFQMSALTMENMMALVKKSIVLKMDTVLPKMQQEAEQLMKNLQGKSIQGGNMDFTKDVMRYVANTSSRCFMGISLSDEMFDNLYTFTQILNKTLVGSYLIPTWAIKTFIQPKLDRLNKKISQGYYEEINKYREDKKKNTSLLLRFAVDSKHQDTGEPLTNEEIANIIVCLLYISSENTALGLINSILDLAKHPEHWKKAMAEAQTLVANNDWKGLINSRYLHACVMESARVNSHAFAVERKPAGKISLGEYYIGDADAVAMGEILLHTHGTAENVFSTPTTYNPERFVRNESKESAGSLSVVTWGAGLHACPGKVFAQYEIKMGIALFLLNFKFDMAQTTIGPKDYFSPSAFSERKLFARILPA